MNQCQLMGRLVRDPELKYTPQGTAVTSFTLAVDRRFNRDKADYINIIAWRQTAEFGREALRQRPARRDRRKHTDTILGR